MSLEEHRKNDLEGVVSSGYYTNDLVTYYADNDFHFYDTQRVYSLRETTSH